MRCSAMHAPEAAREKQQTAAPQAGAVLVGTEDRERNEWL